MKAATNSILVPRLRRKSVALMMTNELRRSSRVSTCSFEQTNQMLGPDGLTFFGVNLVPFGNGFRYNLPALSTNIPSSRKPSTFIGPSSRKPSAFVAPKPLEAGVDKLEKTPFQRMIEVLLSIYEKSRVHYLLPILVLVIYSFLGGAIFYTIEHPAEQSMLLRKKDLVEREELHILAEVLLVEQRIREMTLHFKIGQTRNSERLEIYASISTLNKEIRKYKQFGMNRIKKAIYWYVLQVYFLTDQQTYKSSLLHPNNPEGHWRSHFQSNPSESSIGRIVALRNYTEQLAERCWELGVELNSTELQMKSKLRKSIHEFNKFVGLQHTLAPSWTFWNSMFLAVTTYSTIGYGNITPKTNLGKLAAMVYAAIGIPMTFMVLHKLGRFFLLCFEHFWNKLIWFMEFVSCVKDAEKLKGKVRGTGRMPVLLAIGVAFSWMFLCAAIFLKFEKDWDYFKSFYFFFCSLTTIGYGDVTPTNSEDMFIIFGFIIVGLSLVSMCINVIQLKLEELFEELLLTMMEEYVEAGGTTVEEITATMKPKMSVVDLWKVWKRRRQRRSKMEQKNDQSEEEEMTPVGDAPQQKQPKQSILAIPSKAPSMSRQWPNIAMSEGNFRRVIKLFPFGRRRREAILRRLQLRMNQHSKYTQTDFCCVHGFRYYPKDLHLINHSTQELVEEETLTDSSEPSSTLQHPPVYQAAAVQPDNPTGLRHLTAEEGHSTRNDGSNGSVDSSLKNPRVTITSSSVTSSPIALTISSSTSTGSPFVRRYLPSNSQQNNRRMTASSSQTHCSVHSTPAPPSGHWAQQSGKRRWTFFESAKTPRGEPRGLVVPYMYTRKLAKTHETDEMRRLIAEIDSRLLDCRTLVSPCSRSVSRSSTTGSPSIP
uniref:Potassium channel domain-containing protein n=1 Tax=Globodera rostochiensis TaxID=31243 RepID=A0A914H3Z2_GLORO